MPRKPRRQKNLPPVVPIPQPLQPPPKSDKSHQYSNWATVGAFAVAAMTFLMGAWSKSDTERQLAIFQNQIRLLQASHERMREIEVIPRLMAEATSERIKLNMKFAPPTEEFEKNPLASVRQDDGVKRMPLTPKGDFLKVRNVGRGPALQVIVLQFFDKMVIDEQESPLDMKESVNAAFKMIPAGEFVHYDHFEFQIRPEMKAQSTTGTFGLYCLDTDGYELTWMQHYSYTLHLDIQDDEEPYATMAIASPIHFERNPMPQSAVRDIDVLKKYFRKVLDHDSQEKAHGVSVMKPQSVVSH